MLSKKISSDHCNRAPPKYLVFAAKAKRN